MIVDEDSEGINIFKVFCLVGIPIADVVHRLVTAKNVADRVVHGVVKHTGDVILIRSDVCWITVEALAHLEHACRCAILTPEVLGYLGDSVDTNAIELVLSDDVFNPGFEIISNVRVTVLVEVWKVSEAAILDLGLIVPIDDLAVGMVMFRFVEGIDLAVVSTNGTHMVSDNINHNPDSLGVGRVDEVNEVLLRAEVRVCALPIGRVVAVIAARGILDDRGNPDGVKSHTFDVVKLVDHALVVTTTVVGEVGAGRGGTVGSGKSVGEDLVNASLLPFRSVSSGDSCCEDSKK